MATFSGVTSNITEENTVKLDRDIVVYSRDIWIGRSFKMAETLNKV